MRGRVGFDPEAAGFRAISVECADAVGEGASELLSRRAVSAGAELAADAAGILPIAWPKLGPRTQTRRRRR
jgi:hypothetical protein